MMVVTSDLLKRGGTKGYSRVYGQSFNNFPKNVGFNNGLAPPQPDMIEGLDLTQFESFPVCEILSAAVPTLEPDPPTLPHI